MAGSNLAKPRDDGKTLTSLSKPAVVTYEYDQKTGVVQVNVVSIKKGTYADIKPYDKQKKYGSYDPYYVSADYSNVGKAEWTTAIADSGMDLLDQNGADSVRLIFFSALDFCPHEIPDSFAKGTQYRGCTVLLLKKGLKPMSLLYAGSFTGRPVRWTLTAADIK